MSSPFKTIELCQRGSVASLSRNGSRVQMTIMQPPTWGDDGGVLPAQWVQIVGRPYLEALRDALTAELKEER